MFNLPKGKPEFSKLEESILQYWKENKTFEKSVESRSAENPYRFYDGPPFITGTPHYGSLLSSIIKDVIPRYQTMLGKRVERVWGWDCHGLPIEQKVQKKLGLESNKEIEESEGGIQKFIDECYAYTRDTSAEWNWYIDHIGRWVDTDNAYRTMDQDYMESVMWVFKQIWEKGYIYEGKRVSWYSWKLSTPISNFEIAMDDSYQDVQDPAITVKFPLKEIKKGAGAIIRDEEGKLLMIRNKKDGLWRIPGGHVEEGESYHDAAARELLEETGITCKLEPAYNFYHTYRGSFYYAERFSGTVPVGTKVQLEEDKYIEYEYFALDALPLRSEIHYIDCELFDSLTGVREPAKISGSLPVSFLAWTTTPWTMPMHMALAVNNDISYAQVLCNNEVFILAQSRVETVFKGKGEYQIIGTMRGEELVGLKYNPPFNYYVDKIDEKNFTVYNADFVTDTDGTGIAHEAPEFGDVDFQLAKEKGIYITSAIDEAGKYTSEVPDYAGTLYLDAIDPITERLKTEGKLFKKEGITHRVPYCPRSNTPLIQKAQKSWFIDIQRIKKELIEQNENINWFPEHFKHGRFLKSLESAPDWCVSRSRFWGTPMPVWQNNDGSERVVIDSREELYQRNKPLGQITKLVILRHAESEANVAKRYNDDGLAQLSELGKQQAQELVAKLEKENIDVIISSPFDRAVQTITPFSQASNIPIETMVELKEVEHGKFANAPFEGEEWRLCLDTFRKEDDYKFGETGETKNDLYARGQKVIDHILAKYPGKTVAIVSHSFPTGCLEKQIGAKRRPGKVKNAEPRVIYLDNNTGKEINLHRPYIDRIYVPTEQRAKSKEQNEERRKVLGVHGYNKYGDVVDFFGSLKDSFASQGITVDAPFFQSGEAVDYNVWKAVFEKHFTSDVDMVVTHSMGARMTRQYVVENQIHLHRLVMVAPRFEASARPIMQEVEKNQLTHTFEELRGLVDEIVVIGSEDDPVVPYSSIKKVAEATGGTMITVNGQGHFNVEKCELIENTILGKKSAHTGIKKVLGIHGWTSSGLSKGYEGKWLPIQDILKTRGVTFDVPDFDKSKDTKYSIWRDQLDTLDVGSYDAIMATSFGCPVIMQYLCERKIHIKRLILGAPSWLKGKMELEKIIPEMTEDVEQLRRLVDEIIIIHSEDDTSSTAPFAAGRELAQKLGACFLPVNGVGHGLSGWVTHLFAHVIEHGAPMKRIPEVLDVWMDSASMPYAQVHYPFENVEKMEASFPADFIAEYTGQIRAWFYVMHVIGVLVKGSPAFKNVAVTGVINGTDGRKMSKSYGNYPDPRATIEKYGADAIRFYLMSGTLMKGEDMTFSEMGIQESIKRVLLPLWNAYTFFATYANIDGWNFPPDKGGESQEKNSGGSISDGKTPPASPSQGRGYDTPKTHELDTWIISQLHTLVRDVRENMDNYDLQKTGEAVMVFLEGLNNWYIRRNRRRFWRSELDADKKSAYETLHEVLVTISQLLAPICPFITEYLYKCLTQGEVKEERRKEKGEESLLNNPHPSTFHFPPSTDFSVHLTDFPIANEALINLSVNQKMSDLQNLTNLGLAIRGREKLRVRQPLRAASITLELDDSARETLAEELNVKEIHIVKDVSDYVTITYSPDAKKIGATERKQWMKTIIADAKAGKGSLTSEGTLELTVSEAPEGKVILAADEFEAVYTPKEGSAIAFAGSAGYVIGLDTTLDEELTTEGYSRDLIRAIQDARKELGFQVTDRLQLALTSDNDMLGKILEKHQSMIEKETLCTVGAKKDGEGKEVELDEGFIVKLTLLK